MSHAIQDVVNIMRRLDKQTGYNISGLPIKHKMFMSSLACCIQKIDKNRIEYPCSFEFSSQVLNMDNEEFEQVVIHEYAHAYVALESQKTKEPVEFNHHGEQFQNAVKKLGGWFICPTIEESYWERDRQKIRQQIQGQKHMIKMQQQIQQRQKEIDLLQEKPYTVYIVEREHIKGYYRPIVNVKNNKRDKIFHSIGSDKPTKNTIMSCSGKYYDKDDLALLATMLDNYKFNPSDLIIEYGEPELRVNNIAYKCQQPIRTKTGKGRYKTIIDNLKQDDEVYFVGKCVYVIVNKLTEYIR